MKDEIIRASDRRGMHIAYWWEICRERVRWEEQDVGRYIILRWLFERLNG
jgi:hypothetical protein